MKFPLDVEQKLADGFNEVPTETRSKYNAALWEDVIDAIQSAQEARLDPETAKLSELFSLDTVDVDKGIMEFVASLKKKNRTNKDICELPNCRGGTEYTQCNYCFLFALIFFLLPSYFLYR